MDRDNFDLSVYLVTDSGMVPEGIDFLDQVQQAIENGVTTVQLREKKLDTREFIERAIAVKKLTDKAGIPLIINDRVDVALAVDAHLHVGQSDMDCKQARQMLGDDKIIGVSAGTILEVQKAVEDGADYIGIGLCFDTATKITDKTAMGPIGTFHLFELIKSMGSNIKTCLIGGINASNIQRVRYIAKSIDGVAVVSAIMAKRDAGKATRELVELWNTPPPWCDQLDANEEDDSYDISGAIKNTRKVAPLCHHITNNVVKNFSANVTLAIGASPIMSECTQEFGEFAAFPNGGLVLNAGTVTEGQLNVYIEAVKAYNKVGSPIVYDPVAAGASKYRAAVTKKLLVEGHFTVIKGNEGEIFAAAGIDRKPMKGVDSESSEDLSDVLAIACHFSVKARTVVVVTGKTDIVVDGTFNGKIDLDEEDIKKQRVALIRGGHQMMGRITGTGCSLGSVICATVAANPNDVFMATVSACALYKKAGEIAGNKADGPGSFQWRFLDELDACSKRGDYSMLSSEL